MPPYRCEPRQEDDAALGIAHPILAIAAGGYFPGLVSSPFNGVASVRLWL